MTANAANLWFRRVLVGHARVSTADQTPDHQIDTSAAPASPRTTTTSTTHAARRPADRSSTSPCACCGDRDMVKITRLDRLGRSVLHLVTLGAELRERGVRFHVIEQRIDTATAEGRAMFGSSPSSPSSNVS